MLGQLAWECGIGPGLQAALEVGEDKCIWASTSVTALSTQPQPPGLFWNLAVPLSLFDKPISFLLIAAFEQSRRKNERIESGQY